MPLVRVEVIRTPRRYPQPAEGETETVRSFLTEYFIAPEGHIVEEHAPVPLAVVYSHGGKRTNQSMTECCILHGHEIPIGGGVMIVGSAKTMRRVLGGAPRDLGVSVTLVTGTSMTVSGSILGTVTLKAGETMPLDPAYMDEDIGEWSLSRPAGTDPRYRISVRPDRGFNVEKKSAPAEPGGTPTWSRMTTTVSPQAACVIRPER